MSIPAADGGTRILSRLFKSPWLYGGLVFALVTSPFIFWWSLVVGVIAGGTGAVLFVWKRHLVVLAIGIGLIIGGLPYPIAGLIQNVHGAPSSGTSSPTS